jgi:signal transduction histidine kinase
MSATTQNNNDTDKCFTVDTSQPADVLRHMVHAVSNSLNSISTASQLANVLMADERLNDAKGTLSGIEAECMRAARLLRDGRAFASFDVDASRTAVDIVALLQEAAEPFAHSEQVRVLAPPDVPRVNGNEAALKRLFAELLDNAFQYGARQVNVEVSIEDSGRMVRVDLGNDGPAITANPARLFDPFFTSEREQHSGLGLAVAARIVAVHEGSLGVDSSARGTIFHVRLPTDSGSTE